MIMVDDLRGVERGQGAGGSGKHHTHTRRTSVAPLIDFGLRENAGGHGKENGFVGPRLQEKFPSPDLILAQIQGGMTS